jgi:hypothetical protein
LSTASKLLAEQYQSVLEEIKPAVSEAVFERLNEIDSPPRGVARTPSKREQTIARAEALGAVRKIRSLGRNTLR